ncbi:MAG TPA: hypothetical protein VNZ45_03215, partial [Bacteroidia bacterium]|nr:hypothetical protein [Bacteroidia bacterium]
TAKAENWSFFFPEDGRKDYIGCTLSQANRLIERIKKTKKLLIEAEFYKEGTYILEFNTAGLNWSHKGKEGEYVPPKPKISSGGNTSKQGKSNAQDNNDIFEQFFHPSQNGGKISINSNITSSSGGNTTSQTTINGSVIDTKEVVDRVNNMVTIKCLYKNKESQSKTMTIKASFLDADGEVLSEKSINITCSANDAVSANISASGIADKYKSYRVDIQ